MRRLLAGIAFALAACSDSSGPSGVTGTYTLEKLDGLDLPALYFQNQAGKIDVMAGTLVVRADQTFTENLTLRLTYIPSGVTDTETSTFSGTYTAEGGTIVFAYAGSGWNGVVAGRVVTYTYDGHSYRYKR